VWDIGFPWNCKGNKKADCESWNIYCTVGFLFTFIIFHLVFTLRQPVVVVHVHLSVWKTHKKIHKLPPNAHRGRGGNLENAVHYCFRRLWPLDYLFTYIKYKYHCIDWNLIIIFKRVSFVLIPELRSAYQYWVNYGFILLLR